MGPRAVEDLAEFGKDRRALEQPGFISPRPPGTPITAVTSTVHIADLP
jgi:hypothetical protein